MEAIVADLASEQDELTRMLTSCSPGDWSRPSRCAGWTVADVVLHLAQTNELAIASAENTFPAIAAGFAVSPDATQETVDAAAAARVEGERDTAPDLLRARWETSVRKLDRALLACDPHARVQWVAGRLSARTLATTRLAETWIHHGDVSAAFGVTPAPSARLRPIARLAWRTLPYAFERAGRSLAGPVTFELVAPDGSTWRFEPDTAEGPACTTIRGTALDLCLVAARRAEPGDTWLRGEGADADAVLELVRTYA